MLEEGACRRRVPPWFLAFGQRVREKLAASDPWEAQRRDLGVASRLPSSGRRSWIWVNQTALWAACGAHDVTVTFASFLFRTKGACPVDAGTGGSGLGEAV